ncbi:MULTISPECIES: FMN-binding protein [unclassified Sedimentibacter]|uniref:FMN-binding protein n=1 Tax=unclassified Sedimentibacter TaxID=2649220 RepID=UPI0027E0EE7E|nr:FMN-binding protein [Sedimentibacter sp. MB35-C1]WMJ78940.1 FMN-binding protein [Sedimentibacter sp. MB35-C1]
MKKLALLVCVLMLLSMVACTEDKNNDLTEDITDGNNSVGNDVVDEGTVTDNETNDMTDTQTLTGTAQGYGGEVSVTVKVSGDDIMSVEAVGEKETQGVGSNALDQLPAKIEEADSTDVESISGATVTSDAIKEAVDNALEGMK